MTLQTKPTPGDTSWFVHDRFGLFIHWGIYSLAARHEWVKSYEELTDDEYRPYFEHFDPDLYDPKQWARAAKNAGMKYFAITTKHHDGFCLWDSKLTEYKSTNAPCGRDLVKPMVEAFRAEGLRVGLYHSIIDWNHPDYALDATHPERKDKDFVEAAKSRDMSKYREYLHGQVCELLTNYGPVDYLFFDFLAHARQGFAAKTADDFESEKLIKMIREIHPNIVINDRLGVPQDVKTPEQFMPREWVRDDDGRPVVWETCQTFSGSWGYHRDEASWKSVEQLVRMLAEVVSKGGNLLLNVGPTARGDFDERAMDRLEGVGEWMKRHDRSIHGCTAAPAEFPRPQDCHYTYNPDTNRLYCHVFAWPFKHLRLPNLADRFEYAQLLNDASEVRRLNEKTDQIVALQVGDKAAASKDVTLVLPVRHPNVALPVIEIFLKK